MQQNPAEVTWYGNGDPQSCACGRAAPTLPVRQIVPPRLSEELYHVAELFCGGFNLSEQFDHGLVHAARRQRRFCPSRVVVRSRSRDASIQRRRRHREEHRRVVARREGGMAGEIIGRREELLAVEAFLEAVPAGGPALLLAGDAGIGKSMLWSEGVRLARERSFRALAARTTRSETQVAFATLGDLLAPVLEATLPRLVPVQRRALEVALLLRESDGRPPDTHLLGLALVAVVRALARDGALLVALDDVQWIDASSAEVLRFMLRRLEGEKVGACSRPCGNGPSRCRSSSIAPSRRSSGSRSSRFPLPRSIGCSGAGSGSTCRDRIWCACTRSRVEPVLRARARARDRQDRGLRRLRECDSAREPERPGDGPVARAAARVRMTLVAVAAVTTPSVTLLEPLAAGLVDDIELAERQGVVELDGDRIRFTHPLLAPACYVAMPLHRRRRLHRRLAEPDVDLEERARHLAIAAIGADEQIAAALETAAAHARARGAAQAAAE
jgi:AAA ATPase domain